MSAQCKNPCRAIEDRTSKELFGELPFHPCCMVEQALAFVCGFSRPAKPGFPPGLSPVILVILGRLAIRQGLPVFTHSYFDDTGFCRWGEVDVRFGPVVDIGHDCYAFGSVVKTLGNGLFTKSVSGNQEVAR